VGKSSIFNKQVFGTIEGMDEDQHSRSMRMTFIKNGQMLCTTLHDGASKSVDSAKVVLLVFSLVDRVCHIPICPILSNSPKLKVSSSRLVWIT